MEKLYAMDLPLGRTLRERLLSNDPLIVSNVAVNAPFSTSDHESVSFILNVITSDDLAIDCNEITVSSVSEVNDYNGNCKSIVQHFASNT